MDAQMETEEKLASELEDQVSKPLKEKLAELDAAVVRYHLDRSCPNSLAQPLRDRGIDVTTTPEVWLRKASDAEQLSYTHSSHRIVLTKDLDFLGLKQDPGRDHSGIFLPSSASHPSGDCEVADQDSRAHGRQAVHQSSRIPLTR